MALGRKKDNMNKLYVYNGDPSIYDYKKKLKNSEFGCVNCLWASIECKDMSKFEPKNYNNIPSCKSYTYYD